MTDYYKDELIHLMQDKTPEQLDEYIKKLEARVEETQRHIHALKEVKRRKLRQFKTLDNGQRGGK